MNWFVGKRAARHSLGRFTIKSVALFTLVGASAFGGEDEVSRWNRVATDATAASEIGGNPLAESRILAIVQVAVFDAVNSIDPRFEKYAAKLPAKSGASIDAAIASATCTTLVELLPSCKTALDKTMKEALAAIPDGDAKSAGLELGRSAAAAILALRKDDGSALTLEYKPGTKPGDYQPTPPDFTPAFASHWGRVKPFVLESAAQFRPEPPPAVGSDAAKRDIEEVRSIGAQAHSTRNDEQTEIAKFWYENSPQGWNRVARAASASQPMDVAHRARMFALVNLAMAEGFIAGFEAKYLYNSRRPATAIRAGGDKEWLSHLPTPPIPDYPSNHTVLGAAAATVLARCFETDFVAFSMTSGAPYPGITRQFWSFSEAARENGASRILAGIHFRTAVNAGYRQGEALGSYVCEHALRPLAGPAPTPVSSKN
jgi:PAP2 superfamily